MPPICSHIMQYSCQVCFLGASPAFGGGRGAPGSAGASVLPARGQDYLRYPPHPLRVGRRLPIRAAGGWPRAGTLGESPKEPAKKYNDVCEKIVFYFLVANNWTNYQNVPILSAQSSPICQQSSQYHLDTRL